MVVIFLDIDGVLLNKNVPEYKEKFDARLNTDYIKYKIMGGFEKIAYDKAAVDLFDESALANLLELIQSIETATKDKVGIVISSNWRDKGSILQLKELFKQHSFSEKIVAKIPNKIYVVGEVNDFKYPICRGEEIDFWLQQNFMSLGITNFLILDDIDEDISELFEDNFVHCRSGTFDKNDLIKCYAKLSNVSNGFLPSAKHPLHRLNLAIHHEADQPPVHTTGCLRLTVAAYQACWVGLGFYNGTFFRRRSLISFFENRFPPTIIAMISEYDQEHAPERRKYLW